MLSCTHLPCSKSKVEVFLNSTLTRKLTLGQGPTCLAARPFSKLILTAQSSSSLPGSNCEDGIVEAVLKVEVTAGVDQQLGGCDHGSRTRSQHDGWSVKGVVG